MSDFFYRKLLVYQQALLQVKEVYTLTKKFPAHEQYGLSDQIRRAVISIPSNIAEGMGRTSIKEKIHFLEIANGSLTETMCQLEIAQLLEYISNDELNSNEERLTEISRLLNGLKKSLEDKMNNN
ncbi:MAG: four helix bundle protein [Bacteroidaceae bacterium]|nr:four helix bundle protein [Bacteroidaceae bacterium]